MADDPIPPGPCCRLLVCCEPPAAATALAQWLGAHKRTAHLDQATLFLVADTLLGEHRLVPTALEPGPEAVSDEHVRSALQRLEKLHRRIQTELKSILLDLGHSTEPTAKG